MRSTSTVGELHKEYAKGEHYATTLERLVIFVMIFLSEAFHGRYERTHTRTHTYIHVHTHITTTITLAAHARQGLIKSIRV